MFKDHKILSASVERLWQTIERSAEIGPGKAGGLNRPALSTADGEMRDHLSDWASQAGCTLKVDRVGNMFLCRDGLEPDLPPVMIGSHLDTQVAAGRFDGILGVLAGLEVIRSLNDLGISTRRSVVVANWTNEEGVRFQPPMMGSGVFSGALDADEVLALTDDKGQSFGDALDCIGYAGNDDMPNGEIDSYFELHIEQGPILDTMGLTCGIVTRGSTSFGANIIFKGENAHSGPTPMHQRQDALTAAALAIVEVRRIGWKFAPEGRSTSARIDVLPNKYGIIADHAEISIDLRHPEADRAAEMYQEFKAALGEIATTENIVATITKEWKFGGMSFDGQLIDLLKNISTRLNIEPRDMVSLAGHDAYRLASIAPTALIFIPCHNGITHNEAENVAMQDAQDGLDLLLNAILARSNR